MFKMIVYILSNKTLFHLTYYICHKQSEIRTVQKEVMSLIEH